MPGWATMADVEIGVGIDIMYDHQFVENELVVNTNVGTQTVYQMSAASVLPGTVFGSVYLGERHIGVFNQMANGMVRVNDPTGTIASVRVNCKTSKITIVWNDRIKKGESKLVLSYEYYTKD